MAILDLVDDLSRDLPVEQIAMHEPHPVPAKLAEEPPVDRQATGTGRLLQKLSCPTWQSRGHGADSNIPVAHQLREHPENQTQPRGLVGVRLVNDDLRAG